MKTLKRLGFLGKTTLVVTFILSSCSEEIGPCYDMEVHCKELQDKMNKATDPKEKEQYRQFYLAEKHLLENCLRTK